MAEMVTAPTGGGGPDPLADPRCPELLAAQPDQISDVAKIFAIIGETSQQMTGNLGQIAAAPGWQGDAYDTMRSSIGELSPKLGTLGNGFNEVAAALSHYAGVVQTVQSEFKHIAKELTDLTNHYNAVSATYNADETNLTNDTSAKAYDVKHKAGKTAIAADKTAITNDNTDVSNAWSAMNATQGQINELQPKGMALLDRFSDARTHANTRVSGYAGQAPKAPGGFNLLHVGDDVIKFVGKGVVGTIDDIGSIPGDVVSFAKDPSISHLTKLLKDTAIAASVLSVGAGGMSVLLDGSVEEGVEGTIAASTDGGGSVAATAGDGAVDTSGKTISEHLNGIAKGLDNTGKVANRGAAGVEIGSGHVKQGLIDGVEPPDGSDLAGVGEKAVDGLEKDKTALGDLSTALENDPSGGMGAAVGSLSPADQKILDGMQSVPANAQGVEQQLGDTEKAINQATHNLNKYGRPANLAQGQLVDEPAKEKAKDLVGAGDAK